MCSSGQHPGLALRPALRPTSSNFSTCPDKRVTVLLHDEAFPCTGAKRQNAPTGWMSAGASTDHLFSFAPLGQAPLRSTTRPESATTASCSRHSASQERSDRLRSMRSAGGLGVQILRCAQDDKERAQDDKGAAQGDSNEKRPREPKLAGAFRFSNLRSYHPTILPPYQKLYRSDNCIVYSDDRLFELNAA